MVEPNARNSLVALVHRVVASVMGVVRGGSAPAPQNVDGGPRWNDPCDSGDLSPHAKSELFWAAGFWDGEGTAWRSVGRVIISLGQTDRELLDRFQAVIGCGTVRGPYFKNGTHATSRDGYKRKPMFKWQVSGAKALEVIALLHPLVGTAKREQFDRVAA